MDLNMDAKIFSYAYKLNCEKNFGEENAIAHNIYLLIVFLQ
jgi:hypothetical protein